MLRLEHIIRFLDLQLRRALQLGGLERVIGLPAEMALGVVVEDLGFPARVREEFPQLRAEGALLVLAAFGRAGPVRGADWFVADAARVQVEGEVDAGFADGGRDGDVVGGEVRAETVQEGDEEVGEGGYASDVGFLFQPGQYRACFCFEALGFAQAIETRDLLAQVCSQCFFYLGTFVPKWRFCVFLRAEVFDGEFGNGGPQQRIEEMIPRPVWYVPISNTL